MIIFKFIETFGKYIYFYYTMELEGGIKLTQ